MSFAQRYLNRHVLFELGPALVFFFAHHQFGLGAATIAVMVATVSVVAAAYLIDRRVPLLAVVTLGLVLVLGGLSLWLGEASFIQIKPTAGKCLFAAVLFIGLFTEKPLPQRALGYHVHLSPQGWRFLTWWWIAVAMASAAANEIFRRLASTDDWVTFATILTPVSIAAYVLLVNLAARKYWEQPSDAEIGN